ncbi:hypothetical protein K2Z83_22020 [Oscillochloris sp. ZM17-4]|uniref:hypothetical protein n=1 Tax=Oscillochloris sp. ZM17-4 TaxID=2866714 RepID=UPI001C730D5F|nr:hypothetical protein [Oscillochloris sp. ZM17-4]MBX0330343.1 hypothetical protein [Oscillochloris sp. ZM17-4]
MRGRILRKSDLAGGGEMAVLLTRCAGTWLEQPADAAEQERIATAARQLRERRALALELHRDAQAIDAFCIELFRDEAFAPLHFGPLLISKMIAQVGEPPVVEDDQTDIFSDYLRRAVVSVAVPNTRRFLATQLRRLMPAYTEQGRWREAIAIDYSAFRTSLGNEVTPYLAQMALAGLADYYDDAEGDAPA